MVWRRLLPKYRQNTAGTRPKVEQKKMVERPNTIMQIQSQNGRQ
jgi:hypothetical protein